MFATEYNGHLNAGQKPLTLLWLLRIWTKTSIGKNVCWLTLVIVQWHIGGYTGCNFFFYLKHFVSATIFNENRKVAWNYVAIRWITLVETAKKNCIKITIFYSFIEKSVLLWPAHFFFFSFSYLLLKNVARACCWERMQFLSVLPLCFFYDEMRMAIL